MNAGRRRLNGWHRLWIVWTLFTLPASFATAARLSDYSQWESLLDAEGAAKTAAYAAAYERISGRQLNAVTVGASPEQMARESIEEMELYQKVVFQPDAALSAELNRIEQEYRPRIERAWDVRLQVQLVLFGVIWFTLSAGAYAAGVTVAWIRRGFQSP